MADAETATKRTEWTLCVIKVMEAVFCLICLLFHIKSILYKEEPMPHNALFCSTYGGFFILSLSGIFVPISGQKSPPGVDLVFCITAVGLFFVAACVAMHYAEWDPHLIDMSDQEEANHPFFIHCREHAEWSFITGTLFLMHAVIAGDRLNFAKLVIIAEDEEEEDEDSVDIKFGSELELHIFLLTWIMYICNLKCCLRIRRFCNKCCKKLRRRRKKRARRLDQASRVEL